MRELIWVPLVLAAIGTVLACLVSLIGRKRGKRNTSSGDFSKDGISSLLPKTERDVDARERLPHLKMQNGSYRFGDVRLTLRQYDF